MVTSIIWINRLEREPQREVELPGCSASHRALIHRRCDHAKSERRRKTGLRNAKLGTIEHIERFRAEFHAESIFQRDFLGQRRIHLP